jgi:hypothetical protein
MTWAYCEMCCENGVYVADMSTRDEALAMRGTRAIDEIRGTRAPQTTAGRRAPSLKSRSNNARPPCILATRTAGAS